MVLGDDGIIAQAQDAKKQSEASSLQDAVSIAKGEAAIIDGYINQIPMSDSELNTALEKTGEEAITNNTIARKTLENKIIFVLPLISTPFYFNIKQIKR